MFERREGTDVHHRDPAGRRHRPLPRNPDGPRRLRLPPRAAALPLLEAQEPRARGALEVHRAAQGHRAAADVQRDVRRRAAHRERRAHRLPEGQARDPGPRRLDRRDAARSPRPRSRSSSSAATTRSTSTAPIARASRPARSSRACKSPRATSSWSSTRTSCPRRTSSSLGAPLHRPEGRHGAGALGPPEPRLLDAHARASR
jgi:hypothetical protein